MIDREKIYAALFERVSAVALLKRSSRRFEFIDDIPAVDTPALFQVQVGEQVTREPHTPTKRELHVRLFVYVRADQASDAVTASEINPVIDAIEAALEPDVATRRQTLGGLVHHCRIDGDILTDEGYIAGASAAVIPVSILVP